VDRKEVGTIMGLFRTATPLEVDDKPVTIKVEMKSEFVLKDNDLTGLAKHLLWINDNIPDQERVIEIERSYKRHNYNYDYWRTITVEWKEERGGNEIDDKEFDYV
jgi:hypothetical protein